MSIPFSHMTSRVAFSTIFPLLVDWFGPTLRFCHLEFNKEAIPDFFMAHSRTFRGEGVEFHVNLESFASLKCYLKMKNIIKLTFNITYIHLWNRFATTQQQRSLIFVRPSFFHSHGIKWISLLIVIHSVL